MTATPKLGWMTARFFAARSNKPAIVGFLDTTEGWWPLQLAAACRTAPASLRVMLAAGKIDTPGGRPLPELLASTSCGRGTHRGDGADAAGDDTVVAVDALAT